MQCSKCNVDKLFTDFKKVKANSSGRSGICKECHNTINREKYSGYYAMTRQYRRKYKRPYSYKESLYIQQNGCCENCDKQLSIYEANQDHDHNCCPTQITCGNCLRGLLCTYCNHYLTPFDNDEMFKRMLTYRDKYRDKG